MIDHEGSSSLTSLRRAADRAVSAPSFMAYILAQWGETESLSWNQAAERLGCTSETAHRLALCRRPDPSPERFFKDVQRIAAYANVNPDTLARLVREVDAVQSLRQTRPARAVNDDAAGLLMAALDRLERESRDGSSEESGA